MRAFDLVQPHARLVLHPSIARIPLRMFYALRDAVYECHGIPLGKLRAMNGYKDQLKATHADTPYDDLLRVYK